MQFMTSNEKMINIVTRSQTFREKPFPCDSCLIMWNTLPDKSPAAFHCYIKWVQINCLWRRMPPCMHDASKSNLRFGPQCQWYEFKLYPPCFLDMHHLALWTCLVINQTSLSRVRCWLQHCCIFDANGLGYLWSQGGEQTMQILTEPPIAPSPARQHLHRTCKPEHNCLLWEFMSRLHFNHFNDLMEKLNVQ